MKADGLIKIRQSLADIAAQAPQRSPRAV